LTQTEKYIARKTKPQPAQGEQTWYIFGCKGFILHMLTMMYLISIPQFSPIDLFPTSRAFFFSFKFMK
jgi:hypothetical protein